MEVRLGAAAVPPPTLSLQLVHRDPPADLLGRPIVTQHIWIADALGSRPAPRAAGPGEADRSRRLPAWRTWAAQARRTAAPAPAIPGFRRIASPDEREPVGQGTGRLGRELDNRTLAPGHPKLHGHLAVSTPDDIPERQRTPRWGRSPTSPSSRMVALSRAPTAVVRSGSTNRRSYWAGEMVAGGVPAAGRWTGWRPARGSRPGGQVGAGHYIRAAATPTTTPRHRGRRRSPAGRSSGPGPRR